MRADDILAWVKGPDVLDVGCTGQQLVDINNPRWIHGALRRKFHNVWGIDLERANIESLQAMGFQNLTVADAQDFHLSHKFDTIVAGELIEHLENPGGFLSSAKAHLKEGGRIVLTTPYPFGAPFAGYAITKYPRTCQNPHHTLWLCPTTMETLATRVGLRVHHWELAASISSDTESRSWNWFIRATRLLPRRLSASTMLFVLGPAGESGP